MSHNLFEYRPLLINLNGINIVIFALIIIFACGGIKALGNLLNPIVENIGKPYQHRSPLHREAIIHQALHASQ